MTFVDIQPLHPVAPKNALWQIGFRPFFLGAAAFSVLTVLLWMTVYRFGMPIPLRGASTFQWHAHEMIYGYSLAVIAGFLLTAIKNWTGMSPLHGKPLMGLFGLWALARVTLFFGTRFLPLATGADLLFCAGLFFATARPIVLARQKRQAGILALLVLLSIGNASFYLGILLEHPWWVRQSIYGGVYAVIGMILLMGRRVAPMFIEKGVTPPVTLRNFRIVDWAIPPLFMAYAAVELGWAPAVLRTGFASALAVLLLLRLIGWHTPGLWRKPLLWSLYLAFVCLILAFAIQALSAVFPLSPFLPLHAMTYGCIGLITLGMMSRVTLGHTGRSVHAAPRHAATALIVLAAGTMVRVVLPPLLPQSYYVGCIVLAQVAWMGAFAIFLMAQGPMLWQPRADGQVD